MRTITYYSFQILDVLTILKHCQIHFFLLKKGRFRNDSEEN